MRIINTSETIPRSARDKELIYNGLDCCVTAEVYSKLTPDRTAAATYAFSKSLQAPVFDMTLRGIRVDQVRRKKVLAEFRKTIAHLTANFNRLAEEGVGTPCLWTSPAQLKKFFYTTLGLPPVKKRNANGIFAPTTNRDAMEKLSANYIRARPFCEHILRLRELDKMRQFLETRIDPDSRMRTSFNIAGTNTGRFSSALSDFGTGGNVQNIDRRLRYTFIADPGMKFANLDLEQADARNVGAIIWNHFYQSHGEDYAGAYLNAVESGDLHTQVARLVWPGLGWTDDPRQNRSIADQPFYRQDTYRDMAKKAGHGTNYYATPRTMASHLKVETSITDHFQRAYFEAFPSIGAYKKSEGENWHNAVRDQINTARYLSTTHFIRRRFFWGRHNDDAVLREAIAYEPQSMTADEINTGILRLWRSQRVQLLIQVHDNILFQYPEEQEDEIIPWAIETLRIPIPLTGDRLFIVPVEAKTGWNWGDANENNIDGLIKWQGHDQRIRTELPRRPLPANLPHG